MAEHGMSLRCPIHFLTKLTDKIGKLDETDLRTAPKVIMNLRHHPYARSSTI